MARRLLLILPALAVCVVLWVVLSAGGAVRVTSVQLLGGPTRGLETLSLLVRAFTLDGGRRVPLSNRPLRVSAPASGARASWTGTLDASGQAEARLEGLAPSSTDPLVRVELADTGQLLAEGRLSLDVDEWRAGVRRNGGWLPGQTRGELLVSVAPGQGALAVPFASPLRIQVSLAADPDAPPASTAAQPNAAPVAGAALMFELEGAERLQPGEQDLTDAAGAARITIRPLEHAISLRLIAREGQRTGEWYGALPVVPGALHASLQGERLRVRSPIPRDRAYVSWVTERQRLAGAIVPLLAEAGGAAGIIDIPEDVRSALLAAPGWAVAASEYDKRSPGVVGWPMPIGGTLGDVPPQTFDVADRVLLDGSERALKRERAARQARRRLGALLLTGIGLAMGGLFWHEVGALPRSGRRAPAPRDPNRARDVPALTSTRWVLWVALACIALGVTALAYFGTAAR